MKLSDLFKINYGQREYHSKENLSSGKTLLISSQGSDNGCYGFFDIKPNYEAPFITVPSTGTIGQAFVQTMNCSVDDNCLVLIPKKDMTLEYLFYIALAIRRHKWRYMYGRQLTPDRIGRIEIISQEKISFLDGKYNYLVSKAVPNKKNVKEINYDMAKEEFTIGEIFEVQSGDYHSINNLKEGTTPLVSCTTSDNGISGFYNVPKNKTHKDCITVSYDGKPLTTRYHDYTFSAYDNVGVLLPKIKFKKSTLLFITVLLNLEGWRYNYGRKCYKQKLEKLKIKLPIDKKGNIDEEKIREIMKNRDLFGVI